MRMPKKSKFVKPRPIRDRFEAIRPRFFAFMIDWMTWGYIAYAVMYFLQRYWWRYIDFYNPLKLPAWGWPVVIIGTLEMALLTHAFTHSPGMAALRLKLVGADLGNPSVSQRVHRFPANERLFADTTPGFLPPQSGS